MLLLYSLLGLAGKHIVVHTTLRRPTVFQARLDLHAWLQRVAFLTGGYEPDTVELLLALHRARGGRGALLDVGANIGLIAIPFSILTGAAVFAAEAVPDNVQALGTNIGLNALQRRLRVFPFALGSQPGQAAIQVEGDLEAGEGTGTANILPDGSTFECVRQLIEVRTLDSCMSEFPRCSVMKIDTDGYDLKVLEGAVDLLARDRPVIFGEFSRHCMGWHGQTIDDVHSFAVAHGYALWLRRGRGWSLSRGGSDPSYEQDALLIPREDAPLFENLLAG